MHSRGRSLALLGSVGLALLAINCSSNNKDPGAPSEVTASNNGGGLSPDEASRKLDRAISHLAHASVPQLEELASRYNISFDSAGQPRFEVFFSLPMGVATPAVQGVSVHARMGNLVAAAATREGLEALSLHPTVRRIEASPRYEIGNELGAAESSYIRGLTIATAGTPVNVPNAFHLLKDQTVTFKMTKAGVAGGSLALTSTLKVCSDAACATAPLATATANDAGGDARVTYTAAAEGDFYLQASAGATETGNFAIAVVGDSSHGYAFGTKAKATGKDGTGVIVGIVDTGIDWCHPDFIDPATGKSRILYLWDHSLTPQSSEHSPPEFTGYEEPGIREAGTSGTFGVEYTNADINAALASCPSLSATALPTTGVRMIDVDGHGTHVSGTAAGNGRATNDAVNEPAGRYAGAAPKADLIVVKGLAAGIGNTNAGEPPQHLTLGLWYVKLRAEALGKPFVINNSWGTFLGPEDGSTAQEQGVSAVAGRGAVAVFAGGNRGLHRAVAHSPQTIPATGTVDSWIFRALDSCTAATTDAGTPGANPCAVRDVWIWSEGGDTYDVTITGSKGGSHVFPASAFDPTAGNMATIDGLEVWVFGDTAPESTGAKAIKIYSAGNPAGLTAADDWQIGLSRAAGSTGTGNWTAYAYTSKSAQRMYFYDLAANTGAKSHITGYNQANGISTWSPGTLDQPGTGLGVIQVAAMSASNLRWFDHEPAVFEPPNASILFAELSNLASYSGRGPSRDGRILPHIAAPGTNVMSSASRFSTRVTPAALDRDGQHWALSGTSMATPAVTGAIAQILQADPTNFPRPLLKNSAVHDALTNDTAAPNGWLNDGIGKIDVKAALVMLAKDTAPVASALAAVPSTSTPGQTVTFTATATDADGNGTIAEYLWDVDNDGLTDFFTAANTLQIVPEAAEVGAHKAKVIVVDAAGRTAERTTGWTVSPLADAGTDSGLDASSDSGGGGGGDSGTDSGTLTDSGKDSGGGGADSGADSGGGTDSGTVVDSGSVDSGGGEGTDAAAEAGAGGGGGTGGCGCSTAGEESKSSMGSFGSMGMIAGLFGLALRRRRRNDARRNPSRRSHPRG